MIRRNKWLLGFSIIYWVLVLMGVILNAVALQKVPLQTYGLRAYFFSPNVDASYYIPGLYDVGVGYYFITFPSSKQYVQDMKVEVINQNLQKIEVTYSLCYRQTSPNKRIDPNKIYDLYQTIGFQYQQYLIAAVNNIISGVFMTVGQSSSRTTIQSAVVTNINAANDKISVVLSSAVAVEGLWINQLQFSQQIQKGYASSLFLSDAYQQSYETTQLQYQKTKIQVGAVSQQLSLLKKQLFFNSLQLYNTRYSDVIATQFSSQQQRQTRMGFYYQMKRVWTYYNSTKMIFN